MSSTNKPIVSKKKLGSYPYFTVMFSITLSLFVMGLFGLIFIHATRLTEIAQENIEMKVFLDKNIQDNQRISIQRILSAQPYILKVRNIPQIQYISEEDAKKDFIKTYGDDFTKVLEDNPLKPLFRVKIAPQYADSSSLARIAGQLETIDGVNEVFYMEDLILKITRNLKTISIVLLSFAFILLIASILLINNTIKLALYSQRFLIRSMQLVGATRGFIQRPFIIRAVIQGVVSGLIADLFLFILLNYAYSEILYLRDLKQPEAVAAVLGALVVLGAVIGLFSSLRAVNRYLKMSLDELY